jgi:hypothetical protein
MRRSPTRRSRPVRSLVAVAAVVCAASAAARAADRYPIRLDRPLKVDQQFSLVAKGETNQTVDVTANGQAQPQQAQKFTAELTGTVKVLAVNEKTGGPTKEQVTVDKLTKDGTELFPAGTVIVADHTGARTTYTANGTDVDPEKAGVLELVISLDRADKQLGEDAMLGTPTPQPVGGQWDGDTAKVAADMQADQVPVSAEHLKASAKLVKVDQVDGKPVETVEATFSADPLDVGKQMNELTVTGGTLSATITLALPVDPALLATAVDIHLTLKMKGTAGGGAATAEIAMDRTLHQTMTPKP